MHIFNRVCFHICRKSYAFSFLITTGLMLSTSVSADIRKCDNIRLFQLQPDFLKKKDLLRLDSFGCIFSLEKIDLEKDSLVKIFNFYYNINLKGYKFKSAEAQETDFFTSGTWGKSSKNTKQELKSISFRYCPTTSALGEKPNKPERAQEGINATIIIPGRFKKTREQPITPTTMNLKTGKVNKVARNDREMIFSFETALDANTGLISISEGTDCP